MRLEPRVLLCYHIFLLVNVYAVDRKTCQLSGFTNQLKCSSCRKLSSFNLTKLTETCESCCKDDESVNKIKPVRSVGCVQLIPRSISSSSR
ncbi:hypothetical protein FGIG_11837 [Fasciola gigantica]|uniref:15 kDa selenoprotein n=1 Tax=Fasciola gigantica TaxID=46835 RepID=A0A504YJ52_FASGI|nr:hypothetical protein FGIG_11837 [Fasciola gigantica]